MTNNEAIEIIEGLKDSLFYSEYEADFEQLSDSDKEAIDMATKALESVRDYGQGLNDAWNAAKKIKLAAAYGGMTKKELSEVFYDIDYEFTDELMAKLTPESVVKYFREYEANQQSIGLGDEVALSDGRKGYVIHVEKKPCPCYLVMFSSGITEWYTIGKEGFPKKTGNRSEFAASFMKNTFGELQENEES